MRENSQSRLGPPGRRRQIVTFDQAAAFLADVEKGLPVGEVARQARVQPRTVNKHVELARRRREGAAARQAMLIKAIEAHQLDLVRAARALQRALRPSTPPPRTFGSGSGLAGATRAGLLSHLGRSATKATQRWEKLAAHYPLARDAVLAHVAVEVGPLAGRGTMPNAAGVCQAVEAVAVWRWDPAGYELRVEASVLRWGAYGLTESPVEAAADAAALGQPYLTLVAQAADWPECRALRAILDDAAGLRDRLDAQLIAVQISHHVPGRCRYCPDL